jgi:hypothetical protein
VTPKVIRTGQSAVACDVCGRTLLRGEHSDVFLHGGQRRTVCELCSARAAHEGWIREGLDDVTVRRRRGGRPRGLLGRLRPRRALEEELIDAQPAPDEVPIAAAEVVQSAAADEAAPAAEPVAPKPPAPPAAQRNGVPEPPGQHAARDVRAVPTNADLKAARSLDLFNKSEHPRRIAGIARSLGVPSVNVRPSPTEGSVMTIVVGWELSWYRYEVDLGNEAAGVRVVAQGTQLQDLEPGEATPNAAADEAGGLMLAAT